MNDSRGMSTDDGYGRGLIDGRLEITSSLTRHRALSEWGSPWWSVSWLPDAPPMARFEAIAAMTLAELVTTPRPWEPDTEERFEHLAGGLGLTGSQAEDLIGHDWTQEGDTR